MTGPCPSSPPAARATSKRSRGRSRTAIRLHNPSPVRVAVALSVDGANTIDARRTVAADARKWVLDPYETITIRGWQTSDARARAVAASLSEEQSVHGAVDRRTPRTSASSAPCSSRETNCPCVAWPAGPEPMSALPAPARPDASARGGSEARRRRPRAEGLPPPPTPDLALAHEAAADGCPATGIGRAGRSPGAAARPPRCWKRRPRPRSRCAMNTVRSSSESGILPPGHPADPAVATRKGARLRARRLPPSRRNGEGRRGHQRRRCPPDSRDVAARTPRRGREWGPVRSTSCPVGPAGPMTDAPTPTEDPRRARARKFRKPSGPFGPRLVEGASRGARCVIRRQDARVPESAVGSRAQSPQLRRRPVRSCPGAALERAGPGQPDWRAHRLQRRPRVPDRHPAADPRRPVAARRSPGARLECGDRGDGAPGRVRTGRRGAAARVDRLRAGHHAHPRG